MSVNVLAVGSLGPCFAAAAAAAGYSANIKYINIVLTISITMHKFWGMK